ncbi:vitamin K epoxide reductase family protein [Mucilaginibacter sp. L196]|uniref:vitamin K epoxide reductase family protein n=1 Tax=Mucilaginibacter sp. L196 TaxID=1641870 RepID=UPI00131E5DA2|nr:vitamin K epoxide reductase family protein [Mucilaginibacter sp. L196]
MALSFDTNLAQIAAYYLKQLNIPVTGSTFTKTLKQNSYYPSLFSLSNTFDKFKVENSAFRINKEQLHEMPVPFIAFMNNQSTGKDFVTVTKFTDEDVRYLSDKKMKTTKAIFLKDWDGVIFLAQPDEKSREWEYEKNKKAEDVKKTKKQALIFGGAILLICLLYNSVFTTQRILSATTLVILQLIGLTITTLLLAYDIDKSNTFIKNICTGGTKTNCDAVLSSKASKLIGISWSELGFFYFASSLLFIISPSVLFEEKIPLLCLAGLATALYIPFSIYYQYKVVKQWCPMCLGIQSVLLLGLIWSLLHINYLSVLAVNPTLICAILISPLLPPLTWYTLKPILTKSNNAEMNESAYKRLLYNPDIFNALLSQQIKAPEGWDNIGIDIRDEQTDKRLLKVCNPYCGPCADAHGKIEHLLEKNEDVDFKIIFNSSNLEGDRTREVIQHFLSLNRENDTIQMKEILDEWYSNKDLKFEPFKNAHPAAEHHVIEEFAKMVTWCKSAGIDHTPTFYFNGHLLPDTYTIDDLIHIF